MCDQIQPHRFGEVHYQLAMAAAGIGLWDRDIRHDRLVWNEQCKALFGLPADAEISYPLFLSIVHPDDRERIRQAGQEALDKRMEYDAEFRVIWPDGSLHWLAAKGRGMYDSEGRAIRMVGVVQDVSARKWFEEEQRDLEEKKEQFLHIASHELRAPLTAMKGNLQLAERRLLRMSQAAATSPREQMDGAMQDAIRFVKGALVQTDVQNRLISDLLDATRVQTGTLQVSLEPCDLVGIIREAVENHQMFYPSRNIVFEQPELSSMLVLADRIRIGQVINNFIINAIKYADVAGEIRIGISVIDRRARTWVKDSGPGFSEEARQHIWDRFYRVPGIRERTREGGSGLGLGLYICQAIVQRHGGIVGVESVPGKGSRFWFELSLAKEVSR